MLCCRPAGLETPDGTTDPTGSSTPGTRVPAVPATDHDEPRLTAAIDRILAACSGYPVHWVGRRPGKPIDGLLAGRVLVVGDDADLAAVVLRLLRRGLLGSVEVAFAAARRTPVTGLWDLPHGVPAARLAATGEIDLVPLVRDDVGGVLVGVGYLGPVNGTVYVDEHRVLRGAAHRLRVEPDRDKGLAVTVTRRRFAGFGRRPTTILGRAVQIGTVSTTVVRDGIPYARPMERWTFYKHTEPLRLVRGVF